MTNLLKKPQTFVVAGVLGVGLWLGSKLGGLGLGTGGGAGVGIGTPSANSPQASTTDPAAAEPGESGASPASEPATLDIVIDGEGYTYRQRINGKDATVPVPLEQIVELAKQRKGDREGVRVRIQRRGNALPSAEERLAEALRDAGIPDTAVITLKGLIDE